MKRSEEVRRALHREMWMWIHDQIKSPIKNAFNLGTEKWPRWVTNGGDVKLGIKPNQHCLACEQAGTSGNFPKCKVCPIVEKAGRCYNAGSAFDKFYDGLLILAHSDFLPENQIAKVEKGTRMLAKKIANAWRKS